MLKELITIANSLDNKGLSKEAEELDAIINKAAGLWDESLADESTELLREEDLTDLLQAEQAWDYAPDEEWDDPDSYVNSLDIEMDLLQDKNIMPSQIVGDEDLLSMHNNPMALDELPQSLSEGIMLMAEGLLSAADKDNSNTLSLEEIGMAIYDFISRKLEDENPDADKEGLDLMVQDELSAVIDSDDPFGAMLQRMNDISLSDDPGDDEDDEGEE
jgi:hypothetical protein